MGAFKTRGDDVHWSHTVKGNLNAHGWWENMGGPAKKAKVTVQIQVKDGKKWRTLNTAAKTVYSGGGSGKRAAAAWKCTNLIVKNSFRSVIDVDLVGYKDDPSKKVTPSKTFYCGVW
ncbi:hypothetical protein AB0F42_26425 [Streptomyces buecherae]|uniref:hypothetical protein n=1 Tax=Streptomyces buecherae TaxID=2763006 RepID=UPI0033D35EF6